MSGVNELHQRSCSRSAANSASIVTSPLLGGDFKGWATGAIPMQRQADGHSETTIALAPGRYQYKFIVDGQWIPDPLVHGHAWNQHGTLNSVIEVHA